uniref:Uncharacterized protein n=1 Tax=Panagrolaimus sp. JU765 TaxID=591449 RepID=A0AC34Q937_9BILA
MSTPLLVRDWEKDVVYLVQMPRAGAIPSISPFCLKLETWLRIAEVPYHNISNDFTHLSYKGQIPFVELNGRQIADTNYIISEIGRIFNINLDKFLSEIEWANAIAYQVMIENSLLWGIYYFQSINNNFLATTDGIINHFVGVKRFIFKTFTLGQKRRNMAAKCKAMGIGRDTSSEVENAFKKQLNSLSIFLGNKKFLMGDHATTVDAVMFAVLANYYYLPLSKTLKNFIEEKENLMDYVRRMREEYWSDWHDATSKLSLQTKPKPKERER